MLKWCQGGRFHGNEAGIFFRLGFIESYQVSQNT